MSATATYAETPLASDVCAALWTVRVHHATDDWLVLPDGHIDIVLTAGAPPVVAGPASRPRSLTLAAGSETVGVRLRPGAAAAVLGVAADELLDFDVPLADLPGGRATHDGGDPRATGLRLARELTRRPRRREPDAIAGSTAELLRFEPTLEARELARITALSSRQLLRRCERALGLGPKRYARIMRLQAFLAAGRSRPDLTLSALAAITGYADHAHLAGDCRELADRTPGELLGNRRAIAA